MSASAYETLLAESARVGWPEHYATDLTKHDRRFIAERYAALVDALHGHDDHLAVETEIKYQDGRTAVMRHDLRIASVG